MTEADIRPAQLDDTARTLLDDITRSDGVAPLSAGVLAAAADGSATMLALWADDELAGFAAAAEQGERGAAELAISARQRNHGYGTQLVDAVREALATHLADTWFWSHGDFPAAADLAAERGYTRSRELLQLTTDPLEDVSIPQVQLPAGVDIRTFEPGDEDEWLAVNNAAFAWHPEQGHQTLESFRQHVADPDFDPRGVFFAVRDGKIIGFHETKLSDEPGAGPQEPSRRLGEVYVVGVDPAVHAKGVGRALTVAGMRHMRDAGAQAIELYVESDNTAARRLYDSLGFTNAIVHVSYAPPSAPAVDDS